MAFDSHGSRGSAGWIVIHNAHHHNLRGIDISIPRDKFIVITGPSGSGKSTLAFDVLFAEGQRRYLDTLSPHARQFVKQLEKPAVDRIDGLPPAIAIEQRTTRGGANSTVATMTEIWHLLRLLFAKIGERHCHKCRRKLRAASPQKIADEILTRFENRKVALLATVVRGRKGFHSEIFTKLSKWGINRARVDGEWTRVAPGIQLDRYREHTIEAVVAELPQKKSAGTIEAYIKRAGSLGGGAVTVVPCDARGHPVRSEEFTAGSELACPNCGIGYNEPDPREFSFNSKIGACPDCEGRGFSDVFAHERIVPDAALSLAEGAIAPLRHDPFGKNAVAVFARRAHEVVGVDINKPWHAIPAKDRLHILQGDESFEGIVPRLKAELEKGSWGLKNYQAEVLCNECGGTRLRGESRGVLIDHESIANIAARTVTEAKEWIQQLKLDGRAATIAREILRALIPKFEFLEQVGLGYLSLDRRGDSLSGGEAQRIRLAASLGSALTGCLYVLDEPTIGLHPRDNRKLLDTLRDLRNRGNSVVVVEHDEETILGADHVIDLGPGAGRHGGKIVAMGTPKEIAAHPESSTGRALAGEQRRRVNPRPWTDPKHWISIKGAKIHNLHNVNSKFPIGRLTVVTGVSGSGKSTLVRDCLYEGLRRRFEGRSISHAEMDSITGFETLKKAAEVDQAPIGRTPRSVPASYVGFLDEIRKCFALTNEARARGYTASRFSFNVGGGRCEPCGGQGEVTLELSFLPEARVPCESCEGRRYNDETLAVTYKGLDIAQVLGLSVSDAREAFDAVPAIARPLEMLEQVGLGYLTLGQPSNTLSGGEAQRIKLVEELAKGSEAGKALFILDEPTTGLSLVDTTKLIDLLHRFVDRGDTLVVIEHNLEIIREADYIIDLGPEGGGAGGKIVAEGPWAEIIKNHKKHPESWTLKEMLADRFLT
ncbi:MAG: excinuclease ABC subunit UvrA [Planctomycetes bacterium]|nr:excinuclease ABC subunit UvrA [Planctomycetota bacterium]